MACHQFNFLEQIDVLEFADPGATFLLNSPYGPDEVWEKIPIETQRQIIDKKLKFYVDRRRERSPRRPGLGRRINTIMQTCFFAISGVLPREEAIAEIKDSIKKTYGKRGETVLAAELRRRRHGHRRAVRGQGPRLDRGRPAAAARRCRPTHPTSSSGSPP